jgi:hypothetical protein
MGKVVQPTHPMSPAEIVVEGTLKPDGTLELDEKPSLPPGRVKVTLQPAQAGATYLQARTGRRD